MVTGISEETRRQPINTASNGGENRQERQCLFCGRAEGGKPGGGGYIPGNKGLRPMVEAPGFCYCAYCEELIEAFIRWRKRAGLQGWPHGYDRREFYRENQQAAQGRLLESLEAFFGEIDRRIGGAR